MVQALANEDDLEHWECPIRSANPVRGIPVHSGAATYTKGKGKTVNTQGQGRAVKSKCDAASSRRMAKGRCAQAVAPSLTRVSRAHALPIDPPNHLACLISIPKHI